MFFGSIEPRVATADPGLGRRGFVQDFDQWARATFAEAGLEVDESDVAFAELIYIGAMAQFAALDGLDLERFPFRAIDLRRSPERT